MNSYCSLLWSHACLNPDGGLKACCRYENPGAYVANFSSIETAFNSPHFKEIRQQALINEPIAGCYKCDLEEKSGIKSYRQHSNDAFVLEKSKLTDVVTTNDIKFIEYFVGNQCNLKCVSCHPKFSSKWREDYQKLNWEMDDDSSQAADKKFHLGGFPNLERVKILGGEPFMFKNSHHMFTDVNLDVIKNLELWYHTNVTVLPSHELIEVWKKTRLTRLFLSIDGYGELNEYLRFPSKWQDIEKNVREFFKLAIEIPSMTITLQVTVSNCNLFSLSELYQWYREVSKAFHPNERVRANFQPVYDPTYLAPGNLPQPDFEKAVKKLSTTSPIFSGLMRQLQQIPKRPFDKRAVTYLQDLENLRKNSLRHIVPEWDALLKQKDL